MKTYYIFYPRNFANEYDLCYCESADERKAAEADGWERVTRDYAIKACREENWRRETDPSFSGYADNTIIPFHLVGKDYDIDYCYGPDDKVHPALFDGKDRYMLNGYVFEKVVKK